MISGKVALGGLTVEFGNAERRYAEISQEVDALMRAQEKLLGDERELVQELARTYLPELSPEAVSAGLEELRGRMADALAEQAAHRRKLESRLAELPEDVARRELIVAEAERAEAQAARALDGVRQAVERELGSDHARNVAEHRAIMERRSILKARRIRLQTTASAERRGYESDRAFSYLSGRGYDEREYRAGFLTRWLDGWLARRIDYGTLVRNYRVLRTGPQEIHAEIRALSARAAELEAEIDEQQKAVSERLGLMAALEAEASAQRALVDAREALAEVRARYDRLAAEIRAVDASRGRPYEDALAVHREFLQSRTLADLLALARSTVDPKDDVLVGRLDEIRSRLDHIGGKLGPLREELERRASRSSGLADLARTAFTRFTSRRSHFPEELNMGRLVASVLEGRTDAGSALGRIEAAHVRRPLLVSDKGDLDGWFAELSSRFDPELGAVSVEVERDADTEEEVVVYDHHGRVLHRRVTKRKG